MYTETILNMPAGMWALEFTVVGPTETLDTLISLDAADYTLTVTQLPQYVCLQISTYIETENPRFPDRHWFDFTLDARETGTHYRVEWLESVIRLYVDGKLMDEEWPLGQPVQGECTFTCSPAVRDLRVTALSKRPAEEDISLPCPAQFYMPPYHNASVGDCMPFVSGGRYRLVHLFDRRHHDVVQEQQLVIELRVDLSEIGGEVVPQHRLLVQRGVIPPIREDPAVRRERPRPIGRLVFRRAEI